MGFWRRHLPFNWKRPLRDHLLISSLLTWEESCLSNRFLPSLSIYPKITYTIVPSSRGRAAFRILLYLPEFQNNDLGGGVSSANLPQPPFTSDLTGLTRSILVSLSRGKESFSNPPFPHLKSLTPLTFRFHLA